MAKKVIIGAAVVAAAVSGAAIAAQPFLDRQMNAAIDDAINQINQTKGYKASRASSSFNLWTRSVHVDGIAFETQTSPHVTVKVPKLTIEGIGAVALLKSLMADQTGNEDIVEALQEIPLDRISADVVEINVAVPGGSQVDKTIYRDTVVADITDGVAKTLTIASTEKPEPSGDEAITFEPMKIGKTVYNDVDLALNAALFVPQSKLKQLNEMRQLFSSGTMAPYTMKGEMKDAKAAVVIEVGASSMGAARVNPSQVDFNTLLDALKAVAEQTEKGQEDPKVMFGTIGILFRTLSAFEIDEMKLEKASFAMAPEGDDGRLSFAMGTTTLSGIKGGIIDLFEVNDVSVDTGAEKSSIKRAGLSKLDYSGLVQLLSDEKEMQNSAENGMNGKTVLQLIPRGEIFIDGMDVKGEEKNVAINRYRFALTGAKGALPETISLDIEDFKAPFVEDDERFDALRNYGMTELSGDTALKISYEAQNGVLRLDRLHLGIDKLAAAEISASFADMKIDLTQEDADLSAITGQFFASKPTEAQLKLEDRDGGVNRLLEDVAKQQGTDLATVKEALATQVDMLGSILLGDQAEKVLPAVTSFLKDPKAITVKAQPKTDELTTIDLFIELQNAPESAADLLTLEATVP